MSEISVESAASAAPVGWLSPAELAVELSVPAKWVEENMRNGSIPSVKIGRRRWFTPRCRELLEDRAAESFRPGPAAGTATPGDEQIARALAAVPAPVDGWGRVRPRRAGGLR